MRMKLLSDKWQNISITADIEKKLKILEERIAIERLADDAKKINRV